MAAVAAVATATTTATTGIDCPSPIRISVNERADEIAATESKSIYIGARIVITRQSRGHVSAQSVETAEE